MIKIISVSCFLVLLLFELNAQTLTVSPSPDVNFRHPLDLKPSLSGSFGSLRKNHFHSGLDYKTNKRQGYPVYAVADGYISRLKVQIGGFGNAIYIDHRNGYTSVYAHLQKFNELITKIVKDYQYQTETFDIDLPLLYSDIPIKKGDIIGWSGNSGSSSGPHLHFEIRDTKTEEIINPQLLGLALPDLVKPEITGLYVYQLHKKSFDNQAPSYFHPIATKSGTYLINQSPIIYINGETGFGITAFDKNSASDDKNAIYSIDLLIDDKKIYSAAFDRFSFDHTRAINSYLDYPSLLTSGKWIQKSFIEPGTPLKSIYKNIINNGLVNILDNQIHHLQYIVKDVVGNSSELNFMIKYSTETKPCYKKVTNNLLFKYDQVNTFNTDTVQITIPQGTLYNTIDFTYSTSKKPKGAFSSIYHIHNKLTPLHSSISLKIKPDNTLPTHQQKALVVDNKRIAQEGDFEEGYVKAPIKSFGSYYITVDTIPPRIIPINISKEKSIKVSSKILIKIFDDLSGIKYFRGTIDNKWILMEFDPKTSTLWHTLDERTSSGKHIFELLVTDKKLNATRYHATFIR